MQHTSTTTADGSSTLQLCHFNETYHSRNGAYTEAQHIYIQCGLDYLYGTTGSICINIFDVGLGTGLNCILAYVWQQALAAKGLPLPRIAYYGIEKYPIPFTEIEQLNYHTIIAEKQNSIPDKNNRKIPGTGLPEEKFIFPPERIREIFLQMHSCPWEADVVMAEGFTLHKCCADIASLNAEYYRETKYPSVPSLIFYDTFSPATQPQLWDEAIFRDIAAGCTPGSMLLTYCSKGTVKQALRNAGFTLERLSGPPGKRHILRATL